MAASRKKSEEDEFTRALRDIASVSQNKFCFDCGQRGPTYVNMTIGSFVCTTCSGHLRGLNPPHRVKSIAMASFTPEEVDFVRSRGNDFSGKVWGPPRGDSLEQSLLSEPGRVVEMMSQKYEHKRWYVQPTDDMHAEARRSNSTSSARPETGTTSVQGVYQMSGSRSVPNIHGGVHSVQRPSPGVPRTTVASVTSSLQSPKRQSSELAQPFVSQATSPWPQSSPAIDPFAAAPQPHHSNTADSGFANFANFSTSQSTAGGGHQPFSSPQPATSAPVAAAGVIMPAGTTPFPVFPSAGDKYAALANAEVAVGTVNWDGTAVSATEKTSSSHQMGTQSTFASQVAAGSAVVNPFSGPAAMTTVSALPASAAFYNPSQYLLVQTGTGTCYIPAASFPSPYVAGAQFGGPALAAAPAGTVFSAAGAASISQVIPFPTQPPVQYVNNPFLNGGTAASPVVRRDVTNPFL